MSTTRNEGAHRKLNKFKIFSTAEAQLLNATNSSDTINTSANNGNTSSSSESETVTKGK